MNSTSFNREKSRPYILGKKCMIMLITILLPLGEKTAGAVEREW